VDPLHAYNGGVGYPIVVGWITLAFDGGGFHALIGGTIAMLALIVAYRRIVFPSIFGAERRPFLSEFKAVCAAERAAREGAARNIERLRHVHSFCRTSSQHSLSSAWSRST